MLQKRVKPIASFHLNTIGHRNPLLYWQKVDLCCGKCNAQIHIRDMGIIETVIENGEAFLWRIISIGKAENFGNRWNLPTAGVIWYKSCKFPGL